MQLGVGVTSMGVKQDLEDPEVWLRRWRVTQVFARKCEDAIPESLCCKEMSEHTRPR